MVIRVFRQKFKSYSGNRREIKETIKRKLINPKFDVLLIETPIKKGACWTDIFIRIESKKIKEEIKDKLERKGIRVMVLLSDRFLGWISQDLICYSALAKSKKIEKIIEED